MRPFPFCFSLIIGCLRLFAETVPVIAPGAPESIHLTKGPGMEDFATRETVPADHPAFAEAQRIHVLQTPPQVHQLQLNAVSVADLQSGDTVRVRMTLRSGDPNRDAARVPFFVQDREAGYRSLFSTNLLVGGEWETLTFMIPITEDLAAGRIQFCLFLGEAEQTLDVGRFEVTNLGANPATDTVLPDAQVVVSVQGEYVPVDSPRESITGGLPQGWEEDSAWADVDVNYRAQTLNPFEGDHSLRVEVGEIRSGIVQVRVPNIRIQPSHLIRMRIPVRSEDNISATLSLRQREAPYTNYWHANLTARPEWGVVEMLASVREADPNATLMFSFESPGTFELSDFEIEYLTPDQALAGQSFAGNLLHTSTFPLGLTAPWAIGANGTTAEHLGADPEHPGPSGLPALRMTPHNYEGRPMMQITSPFIGKPGEAHTLSLWAKSEQPGMTLHLRMGPPREQLWRSPWQKEVQLTTEWQRYEFTVLLPPAPDMLYLARLTSHAAGTLWVDQIMVELGEQASDFETAGPVEIHAVPVNEWGLYFEDEPLSARIVLHGETQNVARVEATVLDLYGETVTLPALSPDIQTFTLPETNALGSFLVTLQAVDAQDQPLGNPTELLLHRVRKPRHWGRIAPDSPFGTHVAATPTATRMAKALGFNWNRMHYKFNWDGIQRADGSWNFEGVDRRIAPNTENDLLILTHFGGVPQRYSTRSPEWRGNSWYHITAAPRMDAMDAFEDYARRLLEHAGDSLQAVETWNEPFLPGFFVADVVDGRPVRERPEVLVELNRRARAAADAVGYTGLLMWNTGPHYGESEKGFDTAARDLGAIEGIDALSFHRYTNTRLAFPGDRFDQDLATIRETFEAHPSSARIWNSEGGHGLSEIFNLYQNIPPFRHRGRADAQAAQYVRYFLSNFAAGVEKVFIYTWYPQDGWLSNYGYLNVDGLLSHIAPATSNMAWQFEDKTFAEDTALNEGIHAQRYEGETENTVVLLPTGRGPAVLRHTPPGARIHDLYGNPVTAPHNFVTGLLYISAPGLTLAQAAELLGEAEPGEFPLLAEESRSDSEDPISTDVSPIVLWGMILIAGVLLIRLLKQKSHR
ncbi:MAG: hypothetical protein JJU29_00350 [Verrucomicrobia bacterium]|nr:hypothetical protein [Verrucomicrobiota bacterium]MCH8512535.1 hypothetical protein [Kiritimatiellia bacterium]